MQSFLWEVAWVEFMWVGYFAAKWMRQLCSILTLPWGITVVVLVQQINSLYLDINTKYEAIVLTTRKYYSNCTRLSFKTNISCGTNIMLGFVATLFFNLSLSWYKFNSFVWEQWSNHDVIEYKNIFVVFARDSQPLCADLSNFFLFFFKLREFAVKFSTCPCTSLPVTWWRNVSRTPAGARERSW